MDNSTLKKKKNKKQEIILLSLYFIKVDLDQCLWGGLECGMRHSSWEKNEGIKPSI